MKAVVNIEYRYPGMHVGDVVEVEDLADVERGYLVPLAAEEEEKDELKEVSDGAPTKTED